MPYKGTAQAVKQTDVVEKMFALGIEPAGSSPEEYATRLIAEAERYARAIKAANMKNANYVGV